MGQPLSSPEDLTRWAVVAFVAALFYAILNSPTSSNYPNRHSLNTKRSKFSSEDEHSVLSKQRRLNPSGPGNPNSHLVNRKILDPQEINYSDFPITLPPSKMVYKSAPQVQSQRERGNNRVVGESQRRPRRIINAQDILLESMSDDELKFPQNQGTPEAIHHYQQYGELQHSSFPFRENEVDSLGKKSMSDLIMPGILEDKIPAGLFKRDTAPHIEVKPRNINEAFQQITSKTKSSRNGDGLADYSIESLQRNHSKMSEEAIPEPILDKKVSQMEEEELAPDVDVSTRPSSYPPSGEKNYENRFNFNSGNLIAQPQVLFNGGGPKVFGQLNFNIINNQNNNEKSSKEVFLDSNALTKNENSAQALISNLKEKSIKASNSRSTVNEIIHKNSDILKKNLSECIDLRVKLSEQEKALKDLEEKLTRNPSQAAISVRTVSREVYKDEPTVYHNTICLACKNCCHERCGLQRITEDGSEGFKSCAAFGNASVCRRCSHGYPMHVHLNLKYKKVTEMQDIYDVDTRQNILNTTEIRANIDDVKKKLTTLNEEKQKLVNNIEIFIDEMSRRDVQICIDAVKEQFKHPLFRRKLNCVQDIVIEIEGLLARKNN